MPKPTEPERITLELPISPVTAYCMWVERQLGAGLIGRDGTHGMARLMLLDAIERDRTAKTIKVSPRVPNLEAWFNLCVSGTLGIAQTLHDAWMTAAAKAEPKPKPTEPIDPELVARVKAIPAEELDRQPAPVVPERNLFS